jgi:hypothetical protein
MVLTLFSFHKVFFKKSFQFSHEKEKKGICCKKNLRDETKIVWLEDGADGSPVRPPLLLAVVHGLVPRGRLPLQPQHDGVLHM